MVTRALQGVSPAQPLVLVENRVVAGDGAIRWCQFSNRALYDDDGQLVEWQSVGRDVTERRQLEAELAQASERFQDLYDHAPCGYYALDRQGKYVHLNLLTLQWLGLPREEVIGKLGPADFFDDEGKALFNACFPVFLQNGKIGPLEFNLCGRGGEQRRVSVSSTAILNAQGDYVMSRSIMYDVSELHAARQQLHTLNLEQQAMLDNDLIGIAKVKDRVIVWRNPALERIFGYAPGTLQGRTTEEMYVDQEDFLAFGRDAYAVLASGQHYRQQRRMRKVTGEIVWIDVNGVLLEGQGESLWLMQDITAMKQYQEQVEHIAFHDALTHLPNRLLLADRMTQAFALSDRTQTQAAVCYFDLNGFKPINDRYGHDMGDEVLKTTGRRLLQQVRANDTAARIGGDEFVLVLTAVKDPAEVDQALSRVMAAIEQPIDLGGGRVVRVSAAVGTALYPRDGPRASSCCVRRTRPCTPTRGMCRPSAACDPSWAPLHQYLSVALHQHPSDVVPLRRLHRRDRKAAALLQHPHVRQCRVGAQLGQADQPRLANGLHVQQQPARVVCRGLGIVVRRCGVELGGVGAGAAGHAGQTGNAGLGAAGVIEQHAVTHLHRIAHEVAGLVVAHAGPGHSRAGRGQSVVDGALVRLGLHEPELGGPSAGGDAGGGRGSDHARILSKMERVMAGGGGSGGAADGWCLLYK